MVGRTSFGHITESDFSHLLQALSATTKGRAFLAEYRRRSRPEDTFVLLDSLKRIEATIATVRDQLQPGRIADELRRIAMTLEIAIEGAAADPDGDEMARRMALTARAAAEITALAGGLANGEAYAEEEWPAPQAEASPTGAADLIEDDLVLIDPLSEADPDYPAAR